MFRSTLIQSAPESLKQTLHKHLSSLLSGMAVDLSSRTLSMFIRRMFALLREVKGKL